MCTLVNAWLVKKKATAHAVGGNIMHGKSCVHISKCACWYKKNITSASCR